MDELKKLADETYSALAHYAMPKTCYLEGATGNLLRYKKEFYIITCKHVADVFFDNNDSEVILRNNFRIKKNRLKYVQRTNNDIDIAVLKLMDNKLESGYFSIENFEFIDDFSTHSFKESLFFICGYPENINFVKDDKKYILYMTYLTERSDIKSPTKDFIFIQYNQNSESNRVVKTKLKSKLPNPKGMSGAFLLKLNTFKRKKEELWTPYLAKVIGIQISWNKKNLLKCSNIYYLRKLLSQS